MDLGVPKMAAAGILGVSGLTSIFGRIGTGMVADRVGAKRTLLSALSLQAGLISLSLFSPPAPGSSGPSPRLSASPTGAPCRYTPS
jgi:MFS family permease